MAPTTDPTQPNADQDADEALAAALDADEAHGMLAEDDPNRPE